MHNLSLISKYYSRSTIGYITIHYNLLAGDGVGKVTVVVPVDDVVGGVTGAAYVII